MINDTDRERVSGARQGRSFDCLPIGLHRRDRTAAALRGHEVPLPGEEAIGGRRPDGTFA
jgi:hypothetical protein